MRNIGVSPTRTYVALCGNPTDDGYFFKKFHLPEGVGNNTTMATLYYSTKIDLGGCAMCLTFEDYSNISDCKGEQ